jgi:HD-GYP domain-containing protein (c-di-GMP phosphodiesterase class II)
LLARLIAIPDVFDAVTSARAYRQALSLEAALTLIRQGAGCHFDTGLSNIFVEIAPRLLETRP